MGMHIYVLHRGDIYIIAEIRDTNFLKARIEMLRKYMLCNGGSVGDEKYSTKILHAS